MKKVVYVVLTPFFPSEESFRGSYIYDQVKAIQAQIERDVIVIKLVPLWSHETDYYYQGVKCFIFKVIDFPSFILPGVFNLFNLFRLTRCFRKMKISLPEAIIHAHITYPAGALADGLKKRFKSFTILQHHGSDVFQLTNGRFNQYSWHLNHVSRLAKRICEDMDLTVGVSKSVLRHLREKNVATKAEYVLYNGVDKNKFFPINGLKSSSLFIIGCVANFWKTKDQLALVQAITELVGKGYEDIRVVFIGTGPMIMVCREYINHHNMMNFFEFRTEIDHSKLNVFFNGLDLFVLPSYDEAFGCVYLEAYATGIPFIGVDGQGISEIIADDQKRKYLMPAGNYMYLADIIEQQIKVKTFEMRLLINIDIRELTKNFLLYVNKML